MYRVWVLLQQCRGGKVFPPLLRIKPGSALLIIWVDHFLNFFHSVRGSMYRFVIWLNELWIWNVSLRKGSCFFFTEIPKKIPIVEYQNDVLQKRSYFWSLDYNSSFSEMSWPVTLMPLVLSNFFHPGKSQ